ncbi:MAG: hypothetical protein RIA63_00720 [Cyclobacteriaceae bacterium]
MDVQKLIEKVPHVYHLTSSDNIPLILRNRTLRSTSSMVLESNLSEADKKSLLHSRREDHVVIDVNGTSISIRDQRPISIKSLTKCLENGMTSGEFIKLLNDRVFFWPSLKRLSIHYGRYAHENPAILKISLNDLLAENEEILLCHLNSGATRCHPKWGGAPPPRGVDTFKPISVYNEGLIRLAEVTVLESCTVPISAMIGESPEGPWEMF